jgi:hypothetical protein
MRYATNTVPDRHLGARQRRPHGAAAMRRAAVALALGLLAAAAEAQTRVPAGANLQAAINAAQPGDVLELAAGATFAGNFTLPAKPGSAPITIRTSTPDSTLPASSELDAGDGPLLATLRTANSTPALRTVGAASHWRFIGLQFAAGASQAAVVQLGDGAIADLAAMPRDFVFDRVLIQVDVSARNGLEMNAADVTVRRSAVRGVKLTGVESHTMITWNGPGPFLVEDNYLEAGSCGFFVGGAAPAVPGLVPSDITFRRNFVTRPLALKTQTGYGIKNLFELKNARRARVYGNTFERNWVDGQHGYAIVLTVRANSHSAPWTTIQDVVFENNIVRHTGMGFNILGLDNQTSGGVVYPSTPMDGVTIRNNLIYDLDRLNWGSPTGATAGGVFMQIDGAPRNLHVENNTVVGQVTGNILNLSGSPIPGFRFRRNIVQKLMTPYQTYGLNGNAVGEGDPAFTRYLAPVAGYPASVVTENVLAGCTPSLYASQAGNVFPTVAALMADFVDPASGNYRLVATSPLRALAAGIDPDALELEPALVRPARAPTGLRLVP